MARATVGSNQIVERHLHENLKEMEDLLEGDVLTYLGPVFPFTADWVKYGLETLEGKKDTLYFFLETNGGYVESAERIANVLRHHYKRL